MRIDLRGKIPGLHSLLRALLGWAITASVLLMICTLVFQRSALDASVLGYFSSGISFLAALVFGLLAKGASQAGWGGTAIGGVLLTIILLSLGCLVSNMQLSPDGVISMVCFTLAGVFFGGMILIRKGKKTVFRRKKKGRAKPA